MADDDLRKRWYMGWACAEKTPREEQLRIAVEHFRTRHRRLPAIAAVHCLDGLMAPAGVELIEAEWVREGDIHLYF